MNISHLNLHSLEIITNHPKGEMVYVGGGMMTLGYLASRWF